MTKKSNEQRVSKRVPVKFQVDWKAEGNFLFENASNISEHGIFIETKSPLKVGTKLDLQFKLPEAKEKIDVLGEVTWVNKSLNSGMGIRFLNLNDIDRETILSLIKRIAVL